MQLEDLIERLQDYTYDEKTFILRAFAFARRAHKGQVRKSGEPYIIHPIAVACILAEMHADPDTVAAGLLHDVVEDCNVSREVLETSFNPTVAMLVEGVTKIRKNEVEDPEDREDANLKKIIESITVDIRIFIIKLADRLHNMRTMEYMNAEKQKAKAQETIKVYVHIAYLLGEYKIKNELEDLAFRYAMPKEYVEMQELYNKYMLEKRETFDEVMMTSANTLNQDHYDYGLMLRVKHLYGIYRRLLKNDSINNIHDLTALRIFIDDIGQCYKAKDRLREIFPSVPGHYKDYIVSPKTNRYMGLHNTIYAEDGTMIQLQFMTNNMYRINQYGITEYWKHINTDEKHKIPQEMQDEVKRRQFYQFLEYIGKEDLSFQEYSEEIRSDILSKMIYVETPKKNVVELPENSTVLDYAFRIYPERAVHLWKATVNGEVVPFDKVLTNKDVVRILYDDTVTLDTSNLEGVCTTHFAKRKIKELNKKNN